MISDDTDAGNPFLPPSVSRRGAWSPSGYDHMLLRAILWPVVKSDRSDDASWPTWDFVSRSLTRDPKFEKRSPDQLIAGFPHVQNETRQGYSLIWRSHAAAGPIRPDERVGLTIAGLHVADPLRVDALIRLAASYADDEAQLPLSPTGTAAGYADFVQRAASMLAGVPPSHVGGGPMSITAAAEVLLNEHPPLITRSGPNGWVAHLGPANYEALAGVTTARDYLIRLWARIAPMNKELTNHMSIMQSHQQSVVIVHEPGTPAEVRTPARAHIQAAKGYFDVDTQIYEGDTVEVNDPRGFIDSKTVQTLKMNHVPGSGQSHIAVTWGPASITAGQRDRTHLPAEPKIFLVHGQDSATKEALARFLERATGNPGIVTILHEQANSGRTLIEKFEQHASTSSYAVVLLTPDDVGGPAGSASQHARARQNVIFELGYFAGLIGRNRVMVINAGVEKPSDIDGLVWIAYPAGNWQSDVIRELIDAGFSAQLP